MNDNKNNFNRDNEPSPDREWENNDKSNTNQDQTTDSGSSYYYSYGPFKSLNRDENDSEGDVQHYNRLDSGHVEVTPPQPVKPLPYNTALRTGNNGGGGRGGNGGGGSEGGSGGWQYNKKPKSSVKTAFISFLAGMVVLSGSMFMADRGNWFTGDTAATIADSGSNGSAKTDRKSTRLNSSHWE